MNDMSYKYVVSGTAYGSIDNPAVKFIGKLKIWDGSNTISILSVTVGLPNVGEHFETWNAGVLGSVTLDGLNEGSRHLTFQKWIYQIGLKGESMSLYSPARSSSVQWEKAAVKQPLTWYKATFKRAIWLSIGIMLEIVSIRSNGKYNIDNEFGPLEWDQGAPAEAYTTWAANMAVGLNTGVPWVMCKQDDAPDPVTNTCNGFYCIWFSPNKSNKPSMWTEAWTAWYTAFGKSVPHRPPQDMALAIAAFIQKGGSFVNYYMYHEGTNFGRTTGGPFIATSYDYDGLIDEYGLLRQPKWGHMKDLHQAIKQCEPAILAAGDPVVTSLGHNTWPGDGSCPFLKI